MAIDNVVPIRTEGRQPPPSDPPKRPRSRLKKTPGLRLRESGDGETFSTLAAVSGLHGVCQALCDLESGNELHVDQFGALSSAVLVLSSILQSRIED